MWVEERDTKKSYVKTELVEQLISEIADHLEDGDADKIQDIYSLLAGYFE